MDIGMLQRLKSYYYKKLIKSLLLFIYILIFLKKNTYMLHCIINKLIQLQEMTSWLRAQFTFNFITIIIYNQLI